MPMRVSTYDSPPTTVCSPARWNDWIWREDKPLPARNVRALF